MRRKKLPRSFMAATASRTSPHSRPQKRAKEEENKTKPEAFFSFFLSSLDIQRESG
jgi:hypothetical protein